MANALVTLAKVGEAVRGCWGGHGQHTGHAGQGVGEAVRGGVLG